MKSFYSRRNSFYSSVTEVSGKLAAGVVATWGCGGFGGGVGGGWEAAHQKGLGLL